MASAGHDDATARDDQRPLVRVRHPQGLVDLRAGRGRLVHGQRGVRVRVELDLRLLDVDGQIDQDRARPARTHELERLLEDAGNLCGLQDGDRRLCHRGSDGGEALEYPCFDCFRWFSCRMHSPVASRGEPSPWFPTVSAAFRELHFNPSSVIRKTFSIIWKICN